MPFSDAVSFRNGFVFLDIEVTPGSKIVQVPSGYNEWRKRIEVKLSENAQKGKANEQLLLEIANLFDISRTQVVLENGATNSKKTIRLEGISDEVVCQILEKSLKTVSGKN
ncbi:DUF167 domain-containing protein [Methanolapillus millepedarum]|uniref:UPF0235 protein MsAc7_11880 n=1 Tax=Methanolapillus millepedarum TaxID=3028296 RepID=A0AA96VCH1_9EURY|nr:hypothetical protein MsAc7_11880 [Methanosarcinaceae archaeon Ac7]